MRTDGRTDRQRNKIKVGIEVEIKTDRNRDRGPERSMVMGVMGLMYEGERHTYIDRQRDRREKGPMRQRGVDQTT